MKNLLRKKIPATERIAKDQRILGAFGIAWAIFLSAMPKEVTDACEIAITESGMSQMTYRDDADGIFQFYDHF